MVLLVLYCAFLDKNPSLEIKYRPKKSREKEPDMERIEKPDKRCSTPDYRSERRRGSKVSSFFLTVQPGNFPL